MVRVLLIGEGGLAFWIVNELQKSKHCDIAGVVAGTVDFESAIRDEFPLLPCIGPSSQAWQDWVLTIPCDVLLSVVNLKRIPIAVIRHPRAATINFHDSILPINAGVFAPQNSVARGEQMFGVTWHIVEEGFDTGAIVEQETFEVEQAQSISAIEARLVEAGRLSYHRLMQSLSAGELSLTPQNLLNRTYFPANARPGNFLLHAASVAGEVQQWLHSISSNNTGSIWHYPMARVNGAWHLVLGIHPLKDEHGESELSLANAWSCAQGQFVQFEAEEFVAPDAVSTEFIEHWSKWAPQRMQAHFRMFRNFHSFGQDAKNCEEETQLKTGRLPLLKIVDLMLVEHFFRSQPIFCGVLHDQQSLSFDADLSQLIEEATPLWFTADSTKSLNENRQSLLRALRNAKNAGPVWKTPKFHESKPMWRLTVNETENVHFEFNASNVENRFVKIQSVARLWIGLENETWTSLSHLNQEERDELQLLGNGSFLQIPEDFVSKIWNNTERLDDATAVELGNGQEISYSELGQLILQQERLWARQGKKIAGEVILLQLPVNQDLLIAHLTILVFGGTFCSIHPKETDESIQAIIKKTGSNWGLRAPNSTVQDLFWTSMICAKSTTNDLPRERAQSAPRAEISAILLTSGTTGSPKAVNLKRTGISNHILHLERSTSQVPFNRTLVTSSPAFDGIFEDFYLPLTQGGTVVFQQEGTMGRIAKFNHEIWRRKISILNLNTTLWSAWVGSESFAPKETLQSVNVGGSRMDNHLIKKWFEQCKTSPNNIQLINGYGPTETTVTCSLHQVQECDAQTESVPIGKPQQGVVIRIVDEWYRLVPKGQKGKILIGGRGVSAGYRNEPERTAIFFKQLNHLKVRFNEEEFSTFYDTGDLGFWSDEGLLMFVGRNDEQIKFRGHRVEIGFIENQILKHPGVTHCNVFHEKGKAGEELIAAVAFDKQLEQGNGEDAMASLQVTVNEKVAGHHRPTALIEIKEVPLTHSGKPNRVLIRNQILAKRQVGSENALKQETKFERLAAVFANVLGKNLSSLDLNLSFKDNGGDSLLGMVAQTKMERELGQELPLMLLQTPKSLKNVLGDLDGFVAEKKSNFGVRMVSDRGPGVPVIIIGHTYHGEPNMRNLWPGLARDYTIIALSCDESAQEWLANHEGTGLESYAAKFAHAALDMIGPNPVFCLGTSYSAWLVWHVSLLLSQAGADVRGGMLGEPELYAAKTDFTNTLRSKHTMNGQRGIPTSKNGMLRKMAQRFPEVTDPCYKIIRFGFRIGMGLHPVGNSSTALKSISEPEWLRFHFENPEGRARVAPFLKKLLSRQKLSDELTKSAVFPLIIFHRWGFLEDYQFWKSLTANPEQVQFQAVPVAHHQELMLSTEIIEVWVRKFIDKHLDSRR